VLTAEITQHRLKRKIINSKGGFSVQRRKVCGVWNCSNRSHVIHTKYTLKKDVRKEKYLIDLILSIMNRNVWSSIQTSNIHI
jgi:hypothetical protein